MEQILGLEKQFPNLGSIEVSMGGVSTASAFQSMEKDRERHRKLREEWWKNSDDFESLYHEIAAISPISRVEQMLVKAALGPPVLEGVIPDPRISDIFIWDLDETIILYRSFVNGKLHGVSFCQIPQVLI